MSKFLCLLSSCRMSDAEGDRVRAEHDRQARQLRRRDDAVRRRRVAGDLAVRADVELRGRHLVGDGEGLGRLAVVEARAERQDVGLGDVGLLRELLAQEPFRALGRPVVHPRQQAEREHVLRAFGVLLAEAGLFESADGQRRHGDLVDLEPFERVVLERIRVVPDLRQVPLRELVGVDDEDAAVRQVDDVRLERGGVHRDENVGTVAGRQDVVVGEVQLERRHTGQRALWCADLGGEVGLRGEVVAERRRFRREPVSSELHTVTGVAA